MVRTLLRLLVIVLVIVGIGGQPFLKRFGVDRGG